MDEKQNIPLWIFNFLFHHVFSNALEHLSGIFRYREFKTSCNTLWTFKVPWNWAYHDTLIHSGVAQFAFGFYSVMLTSTILGFITMILFKPRSWCVYCPMGTITQLICKTKNKITA